MISIFVRTVTLDVPKLLVRLTETPRYSLAATKMSFSANRKILVLNGKYPKHNKSFDLFCFLYFVFENNQSSGTAELSGYLEIRGADW